MIASDRLTWQRLTLQLRNPFRLAYGVSTSREIFWIRLCGDSGWGEAAVPPYYGIPEQEMVEVWQAAAMRRDPFPDEIASVADWVGESGPAPARAALDLALHDRIARKQGVPLYRLLGVPQPGGLATSFTIAIASPGEMARAAADAAHFPIIKLKLGSDDDRARIAAVRAARPDARLWVDANAGWSPDEAIAHARSFAPYGLEMIEQPVAREDIAGMGRVQANSDIPIVADESVQTMADVDALAAAGVQGISLKLMKVGGIGPALAMVQRARSHGLRVLLGCMVESSLGVTAMAHLSGLADWLDLDAPLLIANDPFDGIQYGPAATLAVPERPGIGILRPGV